MNTPYAILVSVIVGVTNIIPFFGPYLGAIPSALLILIVDITHPLNCVYFVIFIIILQQLDGNIIGPKILGNSTGLSSFWVIFSITLFGGLFGIPGMIVGVPIFAIIYAEVKYFINHKLKKKKMPIQLDAYSDFTYVNKENQFVNNNDTEVVKEQKQGKNFYSLIKEKIKNKKQNTEEQNQKNPSDQTSDEQKDLLGNISNDENDSLKE